MGVNMAETMVTGPSRLSTTTITLHWIVAIAIIGMLFLGIYIEDFVPGKLADGSRNPFRGYLMGIHKATGVLVLAVAVMRAIWRLAQGWPTPVGVYQRLEVVAAKATHWVLLLATIIMPLSGIIMSQAAGRPISIFGFFDLPMLIGESKVIGGIAHQVHGLGAWVLIAAIALHIAGALKHHFIDNDATLKRMLGLSR